MKNYLPLIVILCIQLPAQMYEFDYSLSENKVLSVSHKGNLPMISDIENTVYADNLPNNDDIIVSNNAFSRPVAYQSGTTPTIKAKLQICIPPGFSTTFKVAAVVQAYNERNTIENN